MTTIAFDGYTLAADKQSSSGDMKRTVTKIFRVGDLAVGCAGSGDRCAEMVEWVRSGRRPDHFPAGQLTSDWAHLIVIEAGRVLTYQQGPFPIVNEDPVYAEGSGRAYALAAMFCGFDARKAVAVATQFDPGSGMGIDAIDVIPRPAPTQA